MEVLYSTGVRRTELCRLRTVDVDQARGVLHVIEGRADGIGSSRSVTARSRGSLVTSPTPARAWSRPRTWGSCF
jgi:integrase